MIHLILYLNFCDDVCGIFKFNIVAGLMSPIIVNCFVLFLMKFIKFVNLFVILFSILTMLKVEVTTFPVVLSEGLF